MSQRIFNTLVTLRRSLRDNVKLIQRLNDNANGINSLIKELNDPNEELLKQLNNRDREINEQIHGLVKNTDGLFDVYDQLVKELY